MLSNKTFIKSALYITAVCAVAIILGGKGITDETLVSLNGDMPKYLMNGVFFHDFIKDFPFNDPMGYAYRYFARYPALSLGHHPLLIGVAEAPFYWLFGISVFSARLTVLFFLLLGTVAWFQLVRSIYEEKTAFYATLLFVTTPFVITSSRIVMSEISTISLIILATSFFHHYCESDKPIYVYFTALAMSLSVYGRHIAVFMFPVFCFFLLIKNGPKSLIKRELLISYLIITVLLFPLVLITLKFANAVVSLVAEKSILNSANFASLSYFLYALWKYHLTVPTLIASALGMIIFLFGKDRKPLIFFLWVIFSFLLCTYMGLKGFLAPRYGIYWIPPLCLFAALSLNLFHNRSWRLSVGAGLILIAGYQFFISYQKDLPYAEGYEEAARYVVDHKKNPCILYSGMKDSGYFIFFIRKHDPDRNFLILRSDKILATSKMRWIVEERINNPDEIFDILKDFGVSYVVVEDVYTGSRPLEWIRELVKTDKFLLRKKVILQSSSSRFNNDPLLIYEYLEPSPLKKGVVLDMNIPLMGDRIKVHLDDLIITN